MCVRPRLAPRPMGGFTLIEILIVVVIIALLVSVAAVSVGVLGRDSQVEEQAKRLWAVLSQAKEEAELQSRNLGLIVDRTGYEFVQFDARRWAWQPIANDDLLSPRQLPPGLEMTLRLDGRDVVLKPHTDRERERSKEDAKSAEPERKSLQEADSAPHIMLLASGDVNGFEVRIERENSDNRWRVYSTPDGAIDYGAQDATP